MSISRLHSLSVSKPLPRCVRGPGWGFLGSFQTSGWSGPPAAGATAGFGYPGSRDGGTRGRVRRVSDCSRLCLVRLVGDGGGRASTQDPRLCLHGGEHLGPALLRHVTAHTRWSTAAARGSATRSAAMTTPYFKKKRRYQNVDHNCVPWCSRVWWIIINYSLLIFRITVLEFSLNCVT